MLKNKSLETGFFLPLKKTLATKSLTIFIFILKFFSRKKRRIVLSNIGKIILYCSTKTQNRAISNIRRAMPQLSQKEAKELAFTAYGNCSFGVSESFWLNELEPDIYCDDHTLSLLKSGKGACIATMHLGCCEAVPLAVAKLTHKSSTLTNIPKFLENGLLFYKETGIDAIDKNSHRSFLELIKKAQENHYISLHSDLRGIDVDMNFFNQKVKAPAGVALLSIMAKKPLLFGYSIYDQQGNIKVCFETIYDEVCHLSPEQIMTIIYQRYEKIIRQHPEQWYWSYNRWRD